MIVLSITRRRRGNRGREQEPASLLDQEEDVRSVSVRRSPLIHHQLSDDLLSFPASASLVPICKC